jgi:DICT domain-containing protein
MHLQPTVANLRAQDHPSSLKHSQRQDFLRQEAHKAVRISAKKRHYIALADEYYRV